MLNAKLFNLLIFCLTLLPANAQTKWYSPMEAGFPVVQNQGWIKELGNTYSRLSQRAEVEVRKPLWNLSLNSAGLAIHFYSNAPEIKVRYGVSGPLSMPHMPNTGVSGIDLYGIDSDGNWMNASGSYQWGDTISYIFTNIGKDKFHNRGFEYRLYLPLYNTVKWLQVGVPENTELKFIPVREEKPIVAYGTSITQGACASRPAMAWTNIVSRTLDYPLINLGFSGNGKLEKEVINYLNELDAKLYILDCLPNLTQSNDNEAYIRIIEAVKQIRSKHATPILLVEHAGYSNSSLDSLRMKDYTRLNKASQMAFKALQTEGIKDIWYLSNKDLKFSTDGWVDYVHPSDLGMQNYADAYCKIIREILHMPVGNTVTTKPVTQRREPDNYEWQARHREILALNRTNPPKAIVLGNSIMHFWGGEPKGPHATGKDSWEAVMKPAGFRNLGYGWDRIENVLWRVYHGELDGFNAEKVVIKIGTNNLGTHSDDEIMNGLRFLLKAIRQRQPEAKIKVVGILPRRDTENKVADLNKRIQLLAKEDGYSFTDVSRFLLLSNGKIDETLFTDGLHPNAKGYSLIAKEIAE